MEEYTLTTAFGLAGWFMIDPKGQVSFLPSCTSHAFVCVCYVSSAPLFLVRFVLFVLSAIFFMRTNGGRRANNVSRF